MPDWEPLSEEALRSVWFFDVDSRIELAGLRLLHKFHKETDCGKPYHWQECETLCDAFGYNGWQGWLEAIGAER